MVVAQVDGGTGVGGCKKAAEVECAGEHGEVAAAVARPLVAGPVPVELDAVSIWIAKVESLADAVIGGAIEWDMGAIETKQGIREGGAGGVDESEVVEAGRAGRRWRAAKLSQVLRPRWWWVAAGGEEGRLSCRSAG